MEFMLDFQSGISRLQAVIDAVISYVSLYPVDSGNHSPGSMIMRRGAPARFPGYCHDSQRMIRFFMQQMNAVSHVRINFIMFLRYPTLVQGQTPGQWCKQTEYLILIHGFRRNFPQVVYITVKAIGF